MKRLLRGLTLLATCVALNGQLAAQECCPFNNYDNCCNDQCCDSRFDGFYIGGNVGFVGFTSHRNDLDGFATAGVASSFSRNNTSWAAGFQLGYDWACNSRVLGVVWDWDWTDAKTNVHPLRNSAPAATERFDSHLRWFSTIRARGGIAVCDTLLYVTAGAAVAHIKSNIASNTNRFNDHHNRWGWTAGFGAEFALWCNWSVDAELLYLHFGNHSKTFTNAAGNARFAFDYSESAWVGRLGFNYRFSLSNLCSCW
ncbi:outer membrane protein [Chlamydiota bacterium]